jgi:hypothetical protein
MPAIKVSACINQRPPDIHAVPAAPAHRLSGPLARGGGDAAAAGRRFDHGAARQTLGGISGAGRTGRRGQLLRLSQLFVFAHRFPD